MPAQKWANRTSHRLANPLAERPPAEDFTYLAHHGLRRVDNIVVKEPQHQEALPGGLVIPPTILLELPRIQVEGQPVNLDDEESFEQEIHRSDALDPDLGLGFYPHFAEQNTRQCLDQRARTTVCFRKYFASLPSSVADQVSAQVVKGDVASAKSTFDHNQGFQRVQAEKRVQQDIRERGDRLAWPGLRER